MFTKDLENRLAEAPVLISIENGKDREALEELLRHPGLDLIWGLMLGAKQTQFELLRHSPLTNMETISRAAAIQGTINGIDLFYQTLLEQTVPSQEPAQEQK